MAVRTSWVTPGYFAVWGQSQGRRGAATGHVPGGLLRGRGQVGAVAVLVKKILGGLVPLIIWEATTAKRNYYRTN